MVIGMQGYVQPKIKFETTTQDFGQIPEEGGSVTHEFVFTNTGNEPLILADVQASCGCTTPEWSREPVAPGEKGVVKAEYNPRNRPGVFSKSISVAANDPQGTHTLYIKGTVTPRPKTPEIDFPAQVGALRTRYRSLNMGKLTTKEPITKSFAAYNDSNQILRFKEAVDVPSHISVSFDPPELLPQQKGNINITYDPKAKDDLGFVTDRISIYTNEAEDSTKEYSIMATIEEYFAPMTQEELDKAPRIAFDRTMQDFGTIKQGEVVSTTFTFTNTGRSTLNIRETKANCGCTVSEPEKTTLAPGESSILRVTFDSAGRRGRQYKSITVFTNDPTKPTRQLTITGIVPGKDDIN
jgi:hypothetical protein